MWAEGRVQFLQEVKGVHCWSTQGILDPNLRGPHRSLPLPSALGGLDVELALQAGPHFLTFGSQRDCLPGTRDGARYWERRESQVLPGDKVMS